MSASPPHIWIDLPSTVKSANNAGGLGVLWFYINGDYDRVEAGGATTAETPVLGNQAKILLGKALWQLEAGNMRRKKYLNGL